MRFINRADRATHGSDDGLTGSGGAPKPQTTRLAPAGGSAAQEYAAAKAVLRAAVTPTSAVLRDLPL